MAGRGWRWTRLPCQPPAGGRQEASLLRLLCAWGGHLGRRRRHDRSDCGHRVKGSASSACHLAQSTPGAAPSSAAGTAISSPGWGSLLVPPGPLVPPLVLLLPAALARALLLASVGPPLGPALLLAPSLLAVVARHGYPSSGPSCPGTKQSRATEPPMRTHACEYEDQETTYTYAHLCEGRQATHAQCRPRPQTEPRPRGGTQGRPRGHKAWGPQGGRHATKGTPGLTPHNAPDIQTSRSGEDGVQPSQVRHPRSARPTERERASKGTSTMQGPS